ncbi:hypothetical protein HJ149_22975 [Vibrio parahaemolyticus]|nr:hypothetical protein [Vibrio parahaemolyticus]
MKITLSQSQKKKRPKKVELKDIMENSFPFHNIFCHILGNGGNGGNGGAPLPEDGMDLKNYQSFIESFEELIKMPDYVKDLLENPENADSILRKYFVGVNAPKNIVLYSTCKWKNGGSNPSNDLGSNLDHGKQKKILR